MNYKIGIFCLMLMTLAAFSFDKYQSAKKIHFQQHHIVSAFSANRYLATKTLYHPQQEKYALPPAGYQPVFINYIGRHGTRFLTDPKDDETLMKILSQAASEDALTSTGYRLQRMMELFEQVEKNNYGNITIRGTEEQIGIAKRMREEYPGVFKGNGLAVIATQKLRTQQSEQAFLKGLGDYPADKVNEQIPPDSLNDALTYYDISPGYKSYKKSKVVKQRLDSLGNDTTMQSVSLSMASAIFEEGFIKKMQSGKVEVHVKNKTIDYTLKDFAEDLYGIYAIHFAMLQDAAEKDIPADSLDFGEFFNREDLQWLSFTDGAGDFMEKGPGVAPMGIQVRDAVPLLVDFINTTDNYIEHPGQSDACLRFSHAEAIAPFAALLGVPEASGWCSSIFKYDQYWQPPEIIPMSANIEWILYTDQQHNYLVKVLLNEKEVALPITTHDFPYYNWEAVKIYYVHLLEALHTGLHNNMHQYLLQLN
jgi:multiple inositol-polyphosphate phosphatase / 2,3-bisphosphoglycerate 3-phosphatase